MRVSSLLISSSSASTNIFFSILFSSASDGPTDILLNSRFGASGRALSPSRVGESSFSSTGIRGASGASTLTEWCMWVGEFSAFGEFSALVEFSAFDRGACWFIAATPMTNEARTACWCLCSGDTDVEPKFKEARLALIKSFVLAKSPGPTGMLDVAASKSRTSLIDTCIADWTSDMFSSCWRIMATSCCRPKVSWAAGLVVAVLPGLGDGKVITLSPPAC
mmetsp:Transcript_115026/g.321475  ORF Transcript_115026/g.321475 Transcript_115026/m.321475 type:complete len:221 (+) Transcript_115026:1148-1810(+)